MNIQTDRALVPASAPAVRYCTVSISVPTPTPADTGQRRPAMRVAFVIDRPGAMTGSTLAIEQAVQMPDLFTSEIGEALDIVARDVTLVLRDSIGARTTCLNDLAADEDVDGVHVRLGDLSAGHEVTLVLATEISAKTEGASTSILLRVEDRERVLYGAPMEVSWRAVGTDTDRAQPVNRNVLVSAAMLLAKRARAEAGELNRVGAFDRALRVLAAAIGRIRAMAADTRAVHAIANDLEDAVPEYEQGMAPMMLKQHLFQSYTARRGRNRIGKGTKATLLN